MLGLAAACSGDDKGPATKDTGGVKPDAAKDKGRVADKSVVLPDKGATKRDAVVKPDAAPASCTPFVAKANSGKLCTADTDCSSDEICLSNDAGTAGSCAGKCCPNLKLGMDDPANTCPVPDSAKQKAFCLWSVQDTGGADLPYQACAFMCSVTAGGSTKAYTCPNTTDKCVKSQDDPNISYCDPA